MFGRFLATFAAAALLCTVPGAALANAGAHHHDDDHWHCCWECAQLYAAMPNTTQHTLNTVAEAGACCCALAGNALRPVANKKDDGTGESEES
ncbi:MAG: hypothetical protein FWE40_01825 [Oscillospiraceae bacterium]|nr:hypothetical protein [Oscillospiraceae bacterium]